MKVKIKKWDAVATWRWDLPEDDVCGICQVHFDGTCPTCKYPGDDCSLCEFAVCPGNVVTTFTWSVPGEASPTPSDHMSLKLTATKHCIMEWIKQGSAKGQCPMCRQKFEWNESSSGQQQQQQQPEVHEENNRPLQTL
ncbi:anaphase-promoting complex subunit 11 [Xylaria sp. FL1777]|nr:anaphase-promoting complex subunit 11 [Xylaria sp. FL1777]